MCEFCPFEVDRDRADDGECQQCDDGGVLPCNTASVATISGDNCATAPRWPSVQPLSAARYAASLR
jgi:hypothetical protein